MRAADVDKLKRDIVEFKTSFQSTNQDYMTGYISALSVVEGMIATLPTLTLADLIPHGRWVSVGADKRGRGGIWKCTACRKSHPYKFDFCPNCGADMRGGGEDGRVETLPGVWKESENTQRLWV